MPEGGTTGEGGDFDQKQKFGVKLSNPWDKISVQSSSPREGFEFNISHETENFKPSDPEVKNRSLH